MQQQKESLIHGSRTERIVFINPTWQPQCWVQHYFWSGRISFQLHCSWYGGIFGSLQRNLICSVSLFLTGVLWDTFYSGTSSSHAGRQECQESHLLLSHLLLTLPLWRQRYCLFPLYKSNSFSVYGSTVSHFALLRRSHIFAKNWDQNTLVLLQHIQSIVNRFEIPTEQ